MQIKKRFSYYFEMHVIRDILCIIHDFKIHFSSHIDHLDAFRVHLGCIALHVFKSGVEDPCW